MDTASFVVCLVLATVPAASDSIATAGGSNEATARVTWRDEEAGMTLEASVCIDRCIPRPEGGPAGSIPWWFAFPERLVVRLEATNTRAEARQWVPGESPWRIYVKDSKGHDMPMTLFARWLYEMDETRAHMGSVQTIQVPPGGAMTIFANVGRLFDIGRGGEYWVVFRKVLRDKEKGETTTTESPPLRIYAGMYKGPWPIVYEMMYDKDSANRFDCIPKVGDFAQYFACKLGEAAREDKDENVRRAARTELEKVRASIDALLQGEPAPPNAAQKQEMKQPPNAPAPDDPRPATLKPADVEGAAKRFQGVPAEPRAAAPRAGPETPK